MGVSIRMSGQGLNAPHSLPACSEEPQVDVWGGVPRQQVAIHLYESVRQRELKPILVGCQDYRLDRSSAGRPGLLQPSRVQLHAVPLPPVGGQHAHDHGGHSLVAGWWTHRSATHQCVAEIRDLQVVTPRSVAHLITGQQVGGDDQVVNVPPVVDCGIGVHLLDANFGHPRSKPVDAHGINPVSLVPGGRRGERCPVAVNPTS